MGKRKSMVMGLLAIMLWAFGSGALAEDVTAKLVGNYDNVAVMEITGNYDYGQDLPRELLAQEFYRTHTDDYDFLVIFTNFKFQMLDENTKAFYKSIKNNTSGIGKSIFDNSILFGSKGKLQGFIDMGAINDTVTNPLHHDFSSTMMVLSHELLHRWAVCVKFKKWDNSISNDLIGSEGSHWSFLLDTKGSVEYGNPWNENGDGTFTSLPGKKYYSTLDLYLMGMIPKEQVPPMLLIENPGIDKTRLPEAGVTINGTPHYITIDDIIAAEGERSPDFQHSQKNFKIGCIYLVRPGTFEGRDMIYELRNVLKNWVIWFSSLTKGRAIAKVDVTPEETIPVNPGVTPPPYDPRTAPPSVQDGLNWLLNAQKEDGSWQDNSQTVEKDTTESVLTLTHFPEADPNLGAGLNWLSGVTQVNTDYLARKIEAFLKAKENTAELVTELLARQNTDGGWGSNLNFESNPSDTAWALRALALVEENDDEIIRPAILYLQNNRNPDGGWGGKDNASTIQATVNVLYAFMYFQQKYALVDVIQGALAWLFGRQNEDGGFGNSPSTIYDTALALSVLKSFSIAPVVTDKALSYLLDHQSENGSWYSSPSQTALAVKALALWNNAVAVDLAINADGITFDPPAVANMPEKVLVKAEVRNLGLINVPQVKVVLYDGAVQEDKKAGELVIAVPARSSGFANFEVTIPDAEAHTFYAVVDPDNAVQEVTKSNNSAFKALPNQNCPKPDLAVNANDIANDPTAITTIPQIINVHVQVHNYSRAEAPESVVALYDGEITPAKKIGEQKLTLAGNASAVVDFQVPVSESRSYALHAVADPGNLMDECSEMNNQAGRTIGIQTTYDFADGNLSITPQTVQIQDRMTISAQIANHGTSDAFNVAVRYFLNTPTGAHEIGRYSLNIPAGKSVSHTFEWQANVVGENMALIMQADPDNIFKELSEENNQAAALITVEQSTKPDLSIKCQDDQQYIVITPLPILEAGNTTISALIWNQGFSEARNVAVEFYQGPSKADMQSIGVQTIAALGPGQVVTVSQDWTHVPVSGSRMILVVVDPGNSIEELNEEDNSAFIMLNIQSLPDLAIATNSIAFSPEAPKEGEMVGIQVSVQNLGDQEADNVTVQVGEGGQTIASGPIAKIAGHSQGTINFQYETQGKPGGHRIDVLVDPANQIPERTKENNTASRSFGVQNADLWVSEPIFSPNGDGIKDSTQFFFRLKQAQTVQVVVVNPKGKVVRTFRGDEFINTSGNAVIWDGLDDQGRLVIDSQYQFQVQSTSNTVLTILPVSLDTDRSPLTDAIGTKYLFQNNLTCALPDVNWRQWLPEESGIVFLIQWTNPNTPGYPEGIYFVSPDGEDIQRIVPAGWCQNNGTNYAYYYDQIALSPDGQSVAFTLDRYNKNTKAFEAAELWVVDRFGEKRVRLLSLDVVQDNKAYFHSLSFSPDSKYLAYKTEVFVDQSWSGKVGLIKADGSKNPVEKAMGYYTDFRWSPDSSRILYVGDKIYALDPDGNQNEYPLANDSIETIEVLNPDQLVGHARWQGLWLLDVTGNGQNKLLVSSPSEDDDIISYEANQQNHTITYRMGYNGEGREVKRVGFCDENGVCRTIYVPKYRISSSYCWNVGEPVWSPDGQRLAIFDRFYEKIDDYNYNGYLIDFDSPEFKGQAFQISDHEQEYSCDNRGSFTWFQDNENLLSEDSGGIFAFSLENNKKTYFLATRINSSSFDPQLSPHKRYIVYQNGVDANSICYGKGTTDLWNIGSLLNLTADLKVIKNKNSITLKGTAADLHFESYTLQYAEIADPQNWKPIIAPADQMIVNNTFLEWVPPHEGIFLVRLVVQDKAGNTAWDRKRVSWGQTISINSLQQSTKIFSPNGDGVLDTVELSYQVAAPVHLQFFIYDADGRLVRTIDKSYLEPGPGSMIWDGQDEQKKVVADGNYTIRVLDYEIQVEVDATPPLAALNLREETGINPEYPHPGGPIYMRFILDGLAEDRNLKDWSLEYGEGENPPDWYELQTGTDGIGHVEKTGQIVAAVIQEFRDELLEFAINNRFRITVTDTAGNRVTINNDATEWVQKIFIREWDDYEVCYLEEENSFKACAEHDTTALIKPGVHRIKGLEDIVLPLKSLNVQYYQNSAWIDVPAMSDPPSGSPELVWDNASMSIEDLKTVQMVRLRAVDINQNEYLSVPIKTGQIEDGENEKPVTFSLIIEYPEASCNSLNGKAELLVKAAMNQAQLLATPISFKKITYYLEEKTGNTILKQYDLEWSWENLKKLFPNQDTVRALPGFEMDTSSMVDGSYQIRAVLEYGQFDEKAHQMKIKHMDGVAFLEVNKVLPIAKIVSPGNGEILCPIQHTQGSLVWYDVAVEAVIKDDQAGVVYALYYGVGENPTLWQLAETCQPQMIYGKEELVCDPIQGGETTGKLAPWDVSHLIQTPMVSLKLAVRDRVGNVRCHILPLKMNTPPAVTINCQPSVFSPNQDGVLDVATVNYILEKDSKIDLKILRADNGQSVKTFISGEFMQNGSHSIIWDGTDDQGQRAPDGFYQVEISIPNVCNDNPVKASAAVEVDNIPPSIEITYPKPDSRPGLIIEVKGTVDDPHFKDYQLIVPEINTLISSGEQAVKDGILARWNRYGLNGRYTLKLTAEDQVGNKSEKIVDVQLDALPDFIKSLEIIPAIFSPNGDGKLEMARVRYELSAAIPEGFKVVLQVLNGQTIVRTYQPGGILFGGSYQWDWDGKNDGGVLMPDGMYALLLTVQSAVDNNLEQKEATTLELDATAPVIHLQTPQEGAYLKDPNVDFKGSVTDKNLTHYELNLQGDGKNWLLDKGQQNRVDYAFARLENPVDSLYSLIFKAEDAAQIVTEQKTVFTVDRTPPKVVLSAPLDNELFGNQKQVIMVKGSIEEKNPDLWVLRYGAGENPSQWKDLVSGSTVPVVEDLFHWQVDNLSGVTDGQYTLQLYARDKAGWEATTKVKATVDNTPPVTAITSPGEGAYISKAADIRGTAFDANLAEYAVEISAGDCAAAYKWTLLKKDTKSVQDETLAGFSALPPDGNYCLRLKALDKVGYESETKVRIIVDTVPPAPPVLSGKVQDRSNALLTWTANSEPDLNGYNLYRDNQKINTALIKDTRFLDQNLKEGTYGYVVKAVDLAGLESEPSNTVGLKIDLTPPVVRILSPLDGSKVSDIVPIKGTAYSEEDFKEYRLYVGQGAAPSAWQMLAHSPVALTYGKLADWDTIALTEDQYAIKLEAEDLSGNVATHQITVGLDNTPPGPPVLTKAEQQGPLIPNVDLAWDASPEPDVIGYLLYRNNELANVSGNVIGDLKPYLIKGTTYADNGLPDGKFTYYVMAMDEAGNISEQSNTRDVNIDTHAPRVIITMPKDGQRFETIIPVKGETPDLDISQVQFQYQKPGETTWNDLNSPVVNLPYITYLDPQALNLTYGTYRLRAQATDLGGRTDEDPAAITVYYTDTTAPAGPINLKARADEGQVILSWNPNSEQDLKGYNVYLVQNSQKTKLNPEIVSGTTTYLHGGSGQNALADAEYVYEITALDIYGNESNASNQDKALIYTPLLEQLYTPSGVSSVVISGSNVKPCDFVAIYLSGTSQMAETPITSLTADEQGGFGFNAVLQLGENWFWAKASDAFGNRSKRSEPMVVVYNEPPATPTGLQGAAQDHTVHLTWNANTEADLDGYFLYRDGQRINQPSSITTGTASASYNNNSAKYAFDRNIYSNWCAYIENGSPQWWQLELPSPTLIEKIELSWREIFYAPQDYDIQTWTGYRWLTLRQIRDNQEISNRFEFKPAFQTQKIRLVIKRTAQNSTYTCLYEVNLFKSNPIAVLPQPVFDDPDRPDGEYGYQVSAVDRYGLESLLSVEVRVPVGDVLPPKAPIDLTAAPDKADVNLTWTANSEPDLAGYQVYRQSLQGWVKINSTLVTSNAYKDAGLANGTYTYRVTATDQIGNESGPSNEASAVINIGVPSEPINLQITVIPEGQALKICWEYQGGPVAGFNLYRALAPGGPYVRVNQELIQDTCYLDEGLLNGLKYYYYVTAVDNFGNEGQNSVEQYAVPADTVAPEPPVIFYPTVSGIPLEVEKADQTLIGFAEPGSEVELFREGNTLAKANALNSIVQQTRPLPDNSWGRVVSAEGRYVAYVTDDNNRLVLKDLNSGQTVTVYEGYVYYIFGFIFQNHFAFSAEDENGNNRVFIYDLKTGQTERLNDDPDAWEGSASWSRDGKQAAFLNNDEIWVKNLISGQMKNIPNTGGAYYPEISPDGSKVVYFKENTLYLADAATGASQVMVSDACQPNVYGTYAWSPDGRHLAFISIKNGANDLYVRDMQSGAVDQASRFQDAGLTLLGFKWSPDNKQWLCLTQKENEYTLWTVPVANPEKAKILKKWQPGWIDSMDWLCGGQVAYNYCVAEKSEIGLIQVPGVFSFDVLLNVGDNIFTATARDAAGNLSGPSDAVTLVLPEQVMPDLEITTDTVFIYPAAPLMGEQITIYAVVENKGMGPATNFYADIYLQNAQGDVALLKSVFIDRMEGHSTLSIPLALDSQAYPGLNTLMVLVDSQNRVFELSEQNNFAERDFYVSSQEGVHLTTTLDSQEYAAESNLVIHNVVDNSGAARQLELVVQIEDQNGIVVHAFEPIGLELGYGGVLEPILDWNTGLTYAGNYGVHAILKEEHQVIQENLVRFKILPEIQISCELGTDKLHYGSFEDVQMDLAVVNQGRNFDIPHLDVKTTVMQGNIPVFSKMFDLDNLPADSSVNLSDVWNTGRSAAGTYTAKAEFLLEGQVIASSLSDFFIDPEVQLSGTLKAVPPTVYFNRPVRADFTVSNQGNTSINELPVKILILDPDSQKVLDSTEKTLTLDQSGNGSAQCEFSTINFSLKTYKLFLQAEWQGQIQTLATAPFSINDGVPPVVIVLAPENQSSQQRSFALQVRAVDDVSGVDKVQYRLDQETQWGLLPPVNPATSEYGSRWIPVEAEEGPHKIYFRASDRAGNVSEPVATSMRIVPRVDMKTTLNAEQYSMNEDVAIKVNLANMAWAKNVALSVTVADPNGVVLHAFDPINTVLAIDESRDFDFAWNTGLNPAGHYIVQAVLTKAGAVLAEQTVAFNILPVLKLHSGLLTDKAHYGLKEDVRLNLSVTNTGNTSAPLLSLKLKIRPEGGEDIYTKDLSLTDLAPNQPAGLLETWNTAQYAAGNYQARLEVYLNSELACFSETGFAIDPVPVITGALDVIPLNVPQGENYQVHYTVRNAGNTNMQDLPVKVLIRDANQSIVAEQQAPVTLGINESKTGSFTFSSLGYNLGSYQAILQAIWDGLGHDLDWKPFKVIDITPPFEKLTGTLQAAPNPVYLGLDESFQYSIHNEAGQALNELLVKILVIDPATQETKITLSEQINLAANSVHTATLKTTTTGLALKTYQVVLKVEMSAKQPRQLAETAFEVIASLEADKIIKDQARLLVWVNDHCPPPCRPNGNGKTMPATIPASIEERSSCQTTLETIAAPQTTAQDPEKVSKNCGSSCKDCINLTLLKEILDKSAAGYKIVFDKCTFSEELRNPIYTDILILGDQEPLTDHVAAELREKVYGGVGLISALWLKHGCSADYDELFGITYKGQLPYNYPFIETVKSPITDPDRLYAKGKPNDILAANTTLIAGWIKGQGIKSGSAEKAQLNCPPTPSKHPAIVLNNYGAGKAIYFAFDLGLTLNAQNQEVLAKLIANSIQYVHRTMDPSAIHPYELVAVELKLKSLGGVFDLRISETFPEGLEIYEPQNKQWISESPWTYETKLNQAEAKNILYYYLAPDQAGLYQTNTEVDFLINGEYVFFKNLPLAFRVEQDTPARLEEVIAYLQGLSLPANDKAKAKNAVQVLQAIKARIIQTRQDVALNIRDLLKAIESLRNIQKVDMGATRLKLDHLLMSQEALYYLFVPPDAYLEGKIEASPNPVRIGQEVNFHLTVANKGDEAFKDLKVQVIVIDPDTRKEVKVLEQPMVLEGNSTLTADLRTRLTGFKAKIYHVLLKAYSALLTEPKVLAEGDLTVTAH